MTLLNDLHHLTFITADMDRLIAFYQRIFDAEVMIDLEEEGLRHAFIAVGSRTVLHPFQVPGIQPPDAQPMFQRGRLDHFAFNAASEDAFYTIYHRIVDEGAGDGTITDMGALLLFNFTDPDGGWHEVVWPKPGVPVDDRLMRKNWTTFSLTDEERVS
jgi:catechol 2,3-dioxygenase-like lactoylglutathione lyase family enzyme